MRDAVPEPGRQDEREAIALEIWHRFADSNVQEWEDETHKAEYLLCADSIRAILSRSPAPGTNALPLDAETRRDLNGILRAVINRHATSSDCAVDIMDDGVDAIFKLGRSPAPGNGAAMREKIGKIFDGWLERFEHGEPILYTPAREYAADALRDVRDLVFAALAAVEQASGCGVDAWRPISTAPKDGGDFLAWGDQHGPHIAYWAQWLDNICQEECEGWRDVHSLDRLPHLTHWQPIDEPDALTHPEQESAPASVGVLRDVDNIAPYEKRALQIIKLATEQAEEIRSLASQPEPSTQAEPTP